MKKHGVLALVLAGVMLLLCGCGGMTTDDAKDYVQSALECLRAIELFCCWDPDRDAVLDGGSARYDRASDRQVPIIYGDYFLTEAILRLTGKSFLTW